MLDIAEYALFSRREMDRRYARARDLMAEQGIDALVVTGEENFQYFAGTAASIALHHSLTRPSVLVLPLERDPLIITQSKIYVLMSTYISDIVEYFDVLSFPHQVVADVLKQVGLTRNRVGVELGREQRMGIPVGAYLALVDTLPRTSFVDAAELIIKLRMVKSAEELAYIRQAAEITGRARQRLFDGEIGPGMTERDVVRSMRRLILEEGGDRTSFVHLQLDLPGSKNQFHYERTLQKGMMLGVDAGAYVRMYTVDYPRMATLGKATDAHKRAHAAAREISREMAAALRPGVKCSDIHRLAVMGIEKAGATVDRPEKLVGSRFGHGQGMLITEPPNINPRDHTLLEPGMVLSTEPGIRLDGVYCLWEDVHVITGDGHEQLTLETPELREIPF
jgi:Xaa-Pro aminopeptidase